MIMDHVKAIEHLWTPLAATPLLWLFVTIAAYEVGLMVQRACRNSAFASPVLIAIVLVAAITLATGTSYTTYFSGAQFINFLLGPATIALAIPLAKNLAYVRSHLRSIGLALLAGSLTSIVSGIVIVRLLGGSRTVALSMAPKAVTTPIAMAVSQEIGGVPALTAALAILGGIVAAVLGQQVLNSLRINDWRAHGLAAGVAGSGVAAARVASRDQLGAAFAALGIGLNGLLTTLLLPPLMSLWN
ncbi:MAG: LrgB family protein [Acetobacteraceae bacterium]|nr:LrgB family protein [Acetobacteraceae bacterium]